jgi:hypothetical protein
MSSYETLRESKGLFKVIALKLLRRTAGVVFDLVPVKAFASIDGIDRVLHEGGALSPGSVGAVERPWYMHPHQEDNLVVLAGFRDVELVSRSTRESARFTVHPDRILMNGSLLSDRPAMLCWPTHVFHRIVSSPEKGSASINIAVRHTGFDIRTNFNVYDLDPGSGEHRVIREGHLDQPM